MVSTICKITAVSQVRTGHVITATHYLSSAHQQKNIHKEPQHIRAGQSNFKHQIWKKNTSEI
jgi:hypothetical protein